ncbi:uncharacterized protein LOC107779043 [Nicotiana tabacum]|uniref:Uncharacterized protein LOC107779043 n=1 Tax=Nicotiana tabacum TaxID=4097 RepID=A0A1S3YRN0_TOBAC
MAPTKNKKQSNNAAESSYKSVVTEKKTPKALKAKRKLVKKFSHLNSEQSNNAVESSSKSVAAEEKTPKALNAERKLVKKFSHLNSEQSNNAAESSSKSVVAEEKTPKALKATRKLVKKFSHLDSAQTEEAEISPQVQARKKDKKAKYGNEGNHAGGKDVKAKRKLVKKFSHLNSAQTKEAEIRPQVQARNKDQKAKDGNEGNHVGGKDANGSQNKNPGNKEMENISGRCGEVNKDEKIKSSLGLNGGSEEVNNKDAKTLNSLGGMIFMCNAKTKADCFRYRVMGVQASKQDVVMGVKPGLKIFLFDFDLKLMYGVYEASSAGGMRLEPAAFGGGFPAQVPFKIHKGCIPLPEKVFKNAIKDNYDERTHKFKTELTVMQVEKLMELFRPTPLLDPALIPVVQDPVAQPVNQSGAAPPLYGAHYNSSKPARNFSPHDHQRQQFADHFVMPREVSHHPNFLTEKDYRSYGLQQAKHLQPSTSAVHVNHKLDHYGLQPAKHLQPSTSAIHVNPKSDHYGSEQGMPQLLRDPASVRSDAAFARSGHVYADPVFPSEREYRGYGLKSFHGQPVTVAPAVASSNTAAAAVDHSLLKNVNPYDESTTSLVNRYLSMPRATIAPGGLPLTGRQSFASASNYVGDTRGHPGRLLAENERSYPPNAPHVLSNHGHMYQHPRYEPGKSSSVLSQYPFAGPSASRR